MGIICGKFAAKKLLLKEKKLKLLKCLKKSEFLNFYTIWNKKHVNTLVHLKLDFSRDNIVVNPFFKNEYNYLKVPKIC